MCDLFLVYVILQLFDILLPTDGAMPMDELVPVFAGSLLGVEIACCFASLRPWAARAVLVAALGAASTWASGEYLESWWFVPLDIEQVAVAAAIAWWLLRRMHRAWMSAASRTKARATERGSAA